MELELFIYKINQLDLTVTEEKWADALVSYCHKL